MKDKAKRDKATIDALSGDLERTTKDYFKYQEIAAKLLKIALDNGAEKSDVFEIIEDSHFLRKRL